MRTRILRALVLACAGSTCGYASQLIANGGFESGLTGWTVTGEAGDYAGSNFFALNSTSLPQTGDTTVGAKTGSFYAVSDSGGSAALILSQSFVVPKSASSVIFSFNMFVNSGSAASVNTANGLDYKNVPSQFGIVSLIRGGTSLFNTTSAGGDLRDFYTGVDTVGATNAYKNYSFDITSLVGAAGGTFAVRFGSVNNVDLLHVGVDNVSVNFTPIGTPEPGTIGLAILGVVGMVTWRRARGSRTGEPPSGF